MSQEREFQDGQLIPGTQYRVRTEIGRGGMGSVYEVEHEALGKRFVLKALLRDLAGRDDLVQRLRNEWRALGRLEHRNIVSVSDAGMSDDGVPFYVMERLQGETLGARLDWAERFSLEESIRVAQEILRGLEAAHNIGIVHRDIKPPNVYLLEDGGVKILDFGIAKILGNQEQLTSFGMAIGTPRYMSPEQAAGEPLDGRADLYAVGLLLFEMVSGVSPFEGADAQQLVMSHLNRPAPRLSSVVPEIPVSLDDLVEQLLRKRPEERPETTSEVLLALDSMLVELGAGGAQRGADRSSADRISHLPAQAVGADETRADAPAVASPHLTPRETVKQDAQAVSPRPPRGTLRVPNKSTRKYEVDQHAPTMASDSDRGVEPGTEDVAMLTDAPPTDAPPTSAMTADAFLAAPRALIDDASETRTSVPGDLSDLGNQTGPRRGAPTLATPPPVSAGGYDDLDTGELDIGRRNVSPMVWGVVGGSLVLFGLGLAAFFRQSEPPPEVDAAAASAPLQGQPIEPVTAPTATVTPTPPFEAATRASTPQPSSTNLAESARQGVSQASNTGAATAPAKRPASKKAPISKPKRRTRQVAAPSSEGLPSPGLPARGSNLPPPKATAEPDPPPKKPSGPVMPVSGL